MSSSYQMQQLTAKLKDSDLDVRLMALTDIGRRAGDGNSLSVDDSTETALVETVLSLFNDSIAEVKSQAARTISILVAKVKEDRVQTIIERLTQMTSDKDDALRDVASLGRCLWRIQRVAAAMAEPCMQVSRRWSRRFRQIQSSQARPATNSLPRSWLSSRTCVWNLSLYWLSLPAADADAYNATHTDKLFPRPPHPAHRSASRRLHSI